MQQNPHVHVQPKTSLNPCNETSSKISDSVDRNILRQLVHHKVIV